jgi:hypothetical protein
VVTAPLCDFPELLIGSPDEAPAYITRSRFLGERNRIPASLVKRKYSYNSLAPSMFAAEGLVALLPSRLTCTVASDCATWRQEVESYFIY